MDTTRFTTRIPAFIQFIILCCVLIFLGCKKDKIENGLTVLSSINSPGSAIRLINITGGNADVTVNNIPLTYQSDSTKTPLGLSIFPKGSWQDASVAASAFNIPSLLLDKNGNVRLRLTTTIPPAILNVGGASQGNAYSITMDTVIHNDPLNPTDYYWNYSNHFIKFKHELVGPSSPSNFKIRIVNLASSGDLFNLNGPFTLTFSDGSIINADISNVPKNTASKYVELPYGAYQFKVFGNGNDKTKQLNLFPHGPNYTCHNIAPGNSYRTVDPIQAPLFTPVQTFKAGGAYDVVITRAVIDLPDCVPFAPDDFYPINSYRIVVENSPPSNVTYGVLQFVNSLPDAPLSLWVDGSQFSDSMRYSTHSKPKPIIVGTHHLEVRRAQGTTVAQSDRTVYAGDDVTAWIYSNNGSIQIIFSDNDVTSTNLTPNGNGFYGLTTTTRNSASIPWQVRFLNLSYDEPYATFYQNLSPFLTRYGENNVLASTNLPQGQPVTFEPYIIYPLNTGEHLGDSSLTSPKVDPYPYPIRVFQSNPNSIPGQLLLTVPAIGPQAFVADSNTLYGNGQVKVPSGEPGIYTVALVGRIGAPGSAPDHAKMIVVKHNQ